MTRPHGLLAGMLAALLALAVPLSSVASAASLALGPAVLTAVSDQRCDDAIEVRPRSGRPASASGTTRLFEARGVASACAGRDVVVTLVGASGEPLGAARGAVPPGGGTVSLAVAEADAAVFLPGVRSVAALVGTWGVGAVWQLPGDALPVVLCVAPVGCSVSYEVLADTEDLARLRVTQGVHFVRSSTVLVNLGALQIDEARRVTLTEGVFTSARITSCDGRFVLVDVSSFLVGTFTLTADSSLTGAVQCTLP